MCSLFFIFSLGLEPVFASSSSDPFVSLGWRPVGDTGMYYFDPTITYTSSLFSIPTIPSTAGNITPNYLTFSFSDTSVRSSATSSPVNTLLLTSTSFSSYDPRQRSAPSPLVTGTLPLSDSISSSIPSSISDSLVSGTPFVFSTYDSRVQPFASVSYYLQSPTGTSSSLYGQVTFNSISFPSDSIVKESAPIVQITGDVFVCLYVYYYYSIGSNAISYDSIRPISTLSSASVFVPPVSTGSSPSEFLSTSSDSSAFHFDIVYDLLGSSDPVPTPGRPIPYALFFDIPLPFLPVDITGSYRNLGQLRLYPYLYCPNLTVRIYPRDSSPDLGVSVSSFDYPYFGGTSIPSEYQFEVPTRNPYEKSDITITWDSGYGDDSSLKSETVKEGTDYSSLYPDPPSRDGFKFTGWSDPQVSEDGNITITAEWEELPPDPDVPGTGPDYSDITDSLNDVKDSVDGVKDSVDGVNDTLNDMKEEQSSFFGSFFEKLVDTILHVFVPDQDDLQSIVDDYNEAFNDKLGFVAQAGDTVGLLFDAILQYVESSEDPTDYKFHFPGVTLPMNGETYEIIPEQDVDLNNKFFDVVRPTLSLIVNILIIFALLNTGMRLFEAIFITRTGTYFWSAGGEDTEEVYEAHDRQKGGGSS